MEKTSLTYDSITIELIETEKQLKEAVNQLSENKELALDLEFDQNRFSYGFNLCLIQITAGTGICFIIDPFKIESLAPVFDLFEDSTITKIIHHSNNDILLLNKLGCNIRNVMDTDVAAKILNYERSSLATVLKEEFNKEIDKSQQSSNWNKRPLTEDQLYYAAIDVIYLHKVKDKLVQEISATGRMNWLEEENRLLENLEYTEPENPHLKLRNAFKLNFYQQYILEKLYSFRDEMAKKFNKPSSYIIPNDALVELANIPNTDVHEWLNHTKGIHGGMKKIANEKLLEIAIQNAKQGAKAENISHDYPNRNYQRPIRTPETEQRKEEITQVHKRIMEKYGEFASRLIITQSVIGEYSQTGKLNCTKKYATDIILETAAELNIYLPSPEVKKNSDN
ncbi:ribonuclease D [Pontibacter silvestris]|uniref:Ribonuclease D n=1 Tax=Pontibacter silvestris TaxID=2305183 RepID=A0ABW4WXQ1_9BACT|nr:HRDC domain-containing protein [Pontibacter silvestris]MCC9136877.1 HRDC domain-containing protein [Pontibacter silvestris]